MDINGDLKMDATLINSAIEPKKEDDLLYFGEATENDIMLNGIPISKTTLEELGKKGYNENDSQAILVEAIIWSKKVYMMAVTKVPRIKRDQPKFRLGMFETIFRYMLGKAVVKFWGKNSIEQVKQKLKSMFFKMRKPMVQRAMDSAMMNEKELLAYTKKHFGGEGET